MKPIIFLIFILMLFSCSKSKSNIQIKPPAPAETPFEICIQEGQKTLDPSSLHFKDEFKSLANSCSTKLTEENK